MGIDAGTTAIMVTVLLALITMGAAWGTLRERVSKTSEEVKLNRVENRQEHKHLFEKLEEIRAEIKNGHRD